MTTATKSNTRGSRTPAGKTKRAQTKKGDTREVQEKRHPRNSDAPTPEQVVADRIIELLDQGELPPWEKGWSSSKMGYPQNAVSGKPYRGINVWMTVITQMIHGYQDPRWMTFRQAKALGGHIKKGEKSTNVVFWKVLQRNSEKDLGVEYLENPHLKGEPEPPEARADTSEGALRNTLKKDRRLICRIYNVFNVEQTEDCELPELETQVPAFNDPIDAAEAVIAGMPNPPAFETYALANHAPHYSPDKDVIRVPERGRYGRVEIYYNTVFHELTHSTGHQSRLARPGVTDTQTMSHEYGVEELVAGMGAAMLGDRAGIGRETLEVDAAYIRGWRDIISGDKSIVIKAAQQAQKAVDYILDYSQEQEPSNQAADPKTEEEDEECTTNT